MMNLDKIVPSQILDFEDIAVLGSPPCEPEAFSQSVNVRDFGFYILKFQLHFYKIIKTDSAIFTKIYYLSYFCYGQLIN